MEMKAEKASNLSTGFPEPKSAVEANHTTLLPLIRVLYINETCSLQT